MWLTSFSQSRRIALILGCRLGWLSNILGFFLLLDLASQSHMLFHTSAGSAQDRPGSGHFRLGNEGHGVLLVLKKRVQVSTHLAGTQIWRWFYEILQCCNSLFIMHIYEWLVLTVSLGRSIVSYLFADWALLTITGKETLCWGKWVSVLLIAFHFNV